MITTYLQGGLGNQLFQIAAAFNLARLNNDEACFNFNSSHTPFQGSQSLKYKDNIYKEFKHVDDLKADIEFNQIGHSYNPIPYQKNLQIQGFFQSEKYFIESKKEFVDKIVLGLKSNKEKHENVIDYINEISFRNDKSQTLVAVHIRRGDYLRFPHIHTLCDLNYYQKALSIMKEKIGDFVPVYISDDKEWCKNTFGGIVSPFNDEISDLILMSNCDHNIIANSSFSWWGAYLNKNPNKMVIGPERWFGPGGPQDQSDTIPENWIKI
jgi:hypothetical protein